MSLGADVNAQVSASGQPGPRYDHGLLLQAERPNSAVSISNSFMVPGALQWPNCPPSGSGPAEPRPGVTPVEVWGRCQQGHLPGLLSVPTHVGPPQHADTAAAGPADPREPADTAGE